MLSKALFDILEFTQYCGGSSAGRTSPCQGEGREFKSRPPLKLGRMVALGDRSRVPPNYKFGTGPEQNVLGSLVHRSEKTMHKYHKEILTAIKNNSTSKNNNFDINNYLGSKAKYYSIKTLVKRKLIKDWARNNKNIQFSDFIDLLNSLNSGESFQEKSSVTELLTCFKKHRQNLDPFVLDIWLSNLSGWAEIDTLCQSTFEPEELLGKWQEWQKLLKAFVSSKNISKRRASLVLLTKAVRKSKDEQLRNLAFKNIKKLQHEKDILITKAVSWLLRSLIKNHKEEVSSYLKENKELMPKIAYRETFSKLKTGKKYIKKHIK